MSGLEKVFTADLQAETEELLLHTDLKGVNFFYAITYFCVKKWNCDYYEEINFNFEIVGVERGFCLVKKTEVDVTL